MKLKENMLIKIVPEEIDNTFETKISKIIIKQKTYKFLNKKYHQNNVNFYNFTSKIEK